MSECVFCDIARGKAKAHIIHQDELVVAFLDTHPIRPGHIQIIPRDHAAYFDDLTPATATRVLLVGQRVARTLKRLFGVSCVAFLFTGGDVAHAHVLPLHEKTDITSRRYIVEERLTFRSTPPATETEPADAATRLSQLGADTSGTA